MHEVATALVSAAAMWDTQQPVDVTDDLTMTRPPSQQLGWGRVSTVKRFEKVEREQ
jgi:hypothetical protein